MSAADLMRLNVDQTTSPAQVIELTFLARLADDRRHGARCYVQPGVAPMSIVPAGASVIASYRRSSGADVLAEGPDYVVFVEAWTDHTLVTVAAVAADLANELVQRIMDEAGRQASRRQNEIAVWQLAPNGGGRRSETDIVSQPWSKIERNYPARLRSQLGVLMARDGISPGEGRLILFHGDPGTGKTTAVRTLVQEWSAWCEGHLVTDPDSMFAQSSYLLDVLQSERGGTAPTINDPPGEAKWKLIIAEDADAYLRSTARQDAGAALGRLLNTTDGLLGQSAKALVLLSTNEELTRLHPALIRPGRCLARLEFVRFSPGEAQAWLGSGGPVMKNPATLAELFEADRTNIPGPGSVSKVGSYL